MRIEFIYWPGNTQVALLDDLDSVKDSFYTSDTHFYEDTSYGFSGGRVMIAKQAFDDLGRQLPPPNVSGAWAEHHPEMQRWRERHGGK